MAENPANRIAIDNPQAKAAFVAWWATMQAQGYQCGLAALCNVWVGFDDGRADLARKVIERVEGEHLESYVADEADFAARERGRHDEDIAYDLAIDHVLTALRELFREGSGSFSLLNTHC